MKYWNKNAIPKEEGWYWCKYKGKRGKLICPCQVINLGDLGQMVITARNDSYTKSNAKEFGTIWFGERIEMPNLRPRRKKR